MQLILKHLKCITTAHILQKGRGKVTSMINRNSQKGFLLRNWWIWLTGIAILSRTLLVRRTVTITEPPIKAYLKRVVRGRGGNGEQSHGPLFTLFCVFNVRLIQMTEMKLFDFTHSHPFTSLELNIVVSRDLDPPLWCQLSLSLTYNVNFHFHFPRANHFASLPSCAAVWKEDGQFWMNWPPWIANVTLILTQDS